MKRDLARLSRGNFDVLVVGGGIHGAAAARDADARPDCPPLAAAVKALGRHALRTALTMLGIWFLCSIVTLPPAIAAAAKPSSTAILKSALRMPLMNIGIMNVSSCVVLYTGSGPIGSGKG